MINVLFLISSAATGGGIQRSVSMISSALNKKEEYSVTVVSLFDYKEKRYDYGKITNHIKGSLKSNNNIKRIFFKAKTECASLLSKVDFDSIVIEGLGLVPLVPKKILKNKSIKIIVRDHSGYSNFKKFGLSWVGLKMSLKYADTFIVLTNENKEEYSRMFPKVRNKFKVIPNTIEPNVKRSPYNPNSNKICFVGRLSTEKGPHLLIDAFSNVINKEQYNEWKLDVYGTGPNLDELKSLVVRKKLEANVVFKGYSNNIINLYKDYAFLVVPSKYESFGIVILEALSVGIPVISFDCNYGPRSLIKHEKNGLLVQNGDVGELSDAINRMISNKEFRQVLSKNTQNINKKFGYSRVISEWENVL
ncbi:glycosyltransferase family 4 protein [Cerasibacillus terrae]|uniref:Glycosyltransferase family 4 protein n=1 Tax=Cerasibacillus terrae TaxID=2498845 RepID=A0A5C8P0M2_9BACI|nr:glycosyltransferase [Cerasibacillus terrae]TXL66775.1 glycosyltransferase family 4 protein [Cerasibacillus terrae]